jgi:DNA repair protein RadC
MRISWLFFLLLIGCTNAKYATYTPLESVPVQFSNESINRYLLTQFSGLDTERFIILYYKDDAYVMYSNTKGATHNVEVNALSIIANCVAKQCDTVVLAHNHPGQYFAKPSDTDLESAKKFKSILNQAKIPNTAFVTVGDHDVYWIEK